ncbi:SixA phosphatase family protein [Pararhizobium haloflavum]|uniref:SixA phosphatase family protein n=1 Tax=Pararhizobium haloflavum TaxID=2037914 RepID=UPI000C194197|nr:histidine phosphatase family protein [Pararhizobium haloflavum]
MDTANISRIFLLRHARSGWAAPGMRDFDRVLDETGRREAERIAIAMALNGFAPSLVLCSPARRCTQTWEIVRLKVAAERTEYVDGLYGEDGASYVDILAEQSDPGPILIVGHNPMMEETAQDLLARGPAAQMRPLRAGFPTAALAVIDIDGPFARAAAGPCRLAAFLTPDDV